MQFYEKLIFLLNLTQVTNRMLAQELQVDPSLISRFRTGRRRLPRNREHIKAMSAYFARRCTTEYQRQALSQMLGIKQALTMKKGPLSEILYYWLCGETDEVGRFMHTFESLTVEAVPENASIHPRLSSENTVYYGDDGKRAAARSFYQHLLALDEPCSIYILSEETDNWISEDCDFIHSIQEWGLCLLHRGFKLFHIAPPATPVDLAFDSLTRWLPLYMTGQVTSYYYPRLRDNLHRRTLIVAPGQIAMTSNSIAQGGSNIATILTTDPRLTQSYAAQFQDYLALCRPIQNIYTKPVDLMQCFTQFLSLNGARIQRVISLSAETFPPELVPCLNDQIQNPDLKKLSELYLQELKLIEENRERFEFIDIACLASAEDVRNGKVPIILSHGDNSRPLYYTVETYILHLKNILHILDTCESYHFVPVDARMQKEGTLMVKEGHKALLVRLPPPPRFIHHIIRSNSVRCVQRIHICRSTIIFTQNRRCDFRIRNFTASHRPALPGAPVPDCGPDWVYRGAPGADYFPDQTENPRTANLKKPLVREIPRQEVFYHFSHPNR